MISATAVKRYRLRKESLCDHTALLRLYSANPFWLSTYPWPNVAHATTCVYSSSKGLREDVLEELRVMFLMESVNRRVELG